MSQGRRQAGAWASVDAFVVSSTSALETVAEGRSPTQMRGRTAVAPPPPPLPIRSRALRCRGSASLASPCPPLAAAAPPAAHAGRSRPFATTAAPRSRRNRRPRKSSAGRNRNRQSRVRKSMCGVDWGDLWTGREAARQSGEREARRERIRAETVRKGSEARGAAPRQASRSLEIGRGSGDSTVEERGFGCWRSAMKRTVRRVWWVRGGEWCR